MPLDFDDLLNEALERDGSDGGARPGRRARKGGSPKIFRPRNIDEAERVQADARTSARQVGLLRMRVLLALFRRA